MRTIIVVILALLALVAVFAGTAAVGFWRLQRIHEQAMGPQAPAAPPGPAATMKPDATARPGEPDGLAVPAAGRIPADAPRDDGAAVVMPALPPPPLPEAAIVLPALEATVRGRGIRVELEGGTSRVAGWRDPDASVSWDLGPRRGGRYAVELSFACGDDAGGAFVVSTGDQRIDARARPTGGPLAFKTLALGTIRLPAEGGTLTLRGGERTGEELMSVREVRLIPLP